LKYRAESCPLYFAVTNNHKSEVWLRMKKTISGQFLAALLAVAAVGVTNAARADIHVGVNVGIPAPVYVVPTPVYAPPPPPVVYQPAPLYAPPVVIGWHGSRYWDGRRYWSRNDYYRHYGYGRGPHGGPPPGLGRDHGHGHGHGGPPGRH
jgi:hypothetical protein